MQLSKLSRASRVRALGRDMWTRYDVIDLALIFIGIVASYKFSPAQKRFAAISTVMATFICHMMARQFLSEYGAGPEPVLTMAIMSMVIAACHLLFMFTAWGLFVSMCFVAINLASGLALAGLIPVTVMQGPGLNYWTIVTICLWLPIFAVLASFMRGSHAASRNSDSR